MMQHIYYMYFTHMYMYLINISQVILLSALAIYEYF